MKTRVGILAITATLALVLGGCQSTQSKDGFDTAVSQSQGGMAGSPEIALEGSYDQPSPAREPSSMMEPSVITTGYLFLIVETPSAAADQIAEIVEESGGRIASRSDYTPIDFGQPSSYLEARIPSSALEETLESISTVGEVQELAVNTVDVSLQKLDLDARIQVLEASIQRLRELLPDANSTSDVIAIQSALDERQADLDSLSSQRAYLSDQTLFATISINLGTPADATPKDPDGFFDGILRGWEGILAFFAGAIVWAGILVPWLGLLLIVVVVVTLIRRTIKRRRRTTLPG